METIQESVVIGRRGGRSKPLAAAPTHIVLFGAGHVGHALVKLLAMLPCVVQWVDARDELFPDEVPGNVPMPLSIWHRPARISW